MPDDKAIVKQIQENPEKGFRTLLNCYKEPVYWHIRRLLVSHEDAKDAAQETFLRVLRHISQYDDNLSFKTWLYKIATNEALRILAKNNGKEMLSLDNSMAELLHLKADDYFDYGDTLAVKLQKAILSLPVKQQIAFNLRYYDELSYEEIAAATDSTAANVKANYHIAKEKIVKYMQSND